MVQKKVQKQFLGVDNPLPSFESTVFTYGIEITPKQLCLPFCFNTFFQPGLYAIRNNQLNKYYIGEASNLASRLSHHISQLNNQNHDCILLQHHWQKNPMTHFDFLILEIGPQWSNRILRLQKQR
jgi:hypothetical protein